MKLPWVWKNVSKFLQFLLLMSCIAGIIVYINPMYLQDNGKEGQMTTLDGQIIDLTEYD
jgi:hypothetical protein